MFAFEMNILKFLEGIRCGWLNELVELITMFGEETLLVILIVTLWFAFDKRAAQKMAFVSLASVCANGVIKNLVRMPRPFASGEVSCVRPETATGYSFPSGHTQNFTTWVTLVAVQLKKKWFSLLAAVMILMVALSRMYLGAHYPSDVIVGMALGVGFAFFGNWLFERVENKQLLYIGVVALMTPFAVGFMIQPDPLYADMYKVYGMMAGLSLAVGMEAKFAPIDYSVCWWKKLLRVVIGAAIALGVKEAGKLFYMTDAVRVNLIVDTLRYFALVVVLLGVSPVLFKKCRL